MSNITDIQVASLAAGFSMGFGILTVWEAIKQTRRNRHPLRSTYIYMLWGEIIANVVILIIGYLWIDGHFGDRPSVPLLFFILFFWVFEIQFLMQIIINRIAVIAECQDDIRKLKYGTAIIITAINIAVFCIFIPAHLVPPVSPLYVEINKYWDRTSKCLICVVDALLNYYFSRTVRKRLVEQHGLVKYAPLAKFNDKLMVVSILMDIMLICLMSYPNPIVFVQFHPVTYMVKLNIEMSMATLITKVARDAGLGDEETNDHHDPSLSYANNRSQVGRSNIHHSHNDAVALETYHTTTIGYGGRGSEEDFEALKNVNGIHKRVDVRVESTTNSETASNEIDKARGRSFDRVEDELSLTNNPGHPRGGSL
ncbi:uncharacterized protein F4812DRAFT_113792 [Daldinia caldariorum]|uniref:uncharacterized protein n=1 Tax=Daldinia caldariorum TaxID=326644 RepID=UPI002008D251|nr:uncharacterized protein F4812DRAFT_113792 [Daldinia caldariorum]KAI1465827.1 hypothetical protein F4812DRAFT_113792 [Daldinia caldariorum]